MCSAARGRNVWSRNSVNVRLPHSNRPEPSAQPNSRCSNVVGEERQITENVCAAAVARCAVRNRSNQNPAACSEPARTQAQHGPTRCALCRQRRVRRGVAEPPTNARGSSEWQGRFSVQQCERGSRRSRRQPNCENRICRQIEPRQENEVRSRKGQVVRGGIPACGRRVCRWHEKAGSNHEEVAEPMRNNQRPNPQEITQPQRSRRQQEPNR